MDKQLKHYRCECGKTTSAVGVIPYCKRCRKSYTEIKEEKEKKLEEK